RREILGAESRNSEEQIVPARYRQEFLTIAWEEVHLRIPLSRSEKCIVGTGLERQVALDSGIPTHVTSHGPERITNEIPHLEAHLLRNLDKNGIVILGSWVEAGDILVGKLTPQMAKESSYAPEDRLLRTILGIQLAKKYSDYDHWRTIPKPADAPESFRLLVRELRSLALELNHFLISEKNFRIHRRKLNSPESYF
ncbi:hypothetical protein Lal_00044956, partial [Lupinus albus]